MNSKPPLVTNPFATPQWRDTGMSAGKTAKLKYSKGEAPAIAYVRSLGIDGLVASQVADEIGCSVQLIRKLQKDPSFKAPSVEVPYGKNKIYVYTPADVEELRSYWTRQRQPRARN